MGTSSEIDASPDGPVQNWPRTRSVLTEAIGLSETERRRLVAAACAGKPGLRDELLAILASYDVAARVCEAARWNSAAIGTVSPGVRAPAVESDDQVLSPDTTYGPYHVIKQLGAGGMGQVFLARDVRLNRQVAVKSLAGRWLVSPTARQRLMREARSAAALTHPHIATLYDVFEGDGRLLLVMEYVQGRSASSRLEEGPIPIGYALRLAIQVADAVSYAHDRGIIHCDIKPANVQVAVDGTAKVLDFGLARARFELGDADETSADDQRQLLGTLGYMAPERLVEGTLNASGDIYSLGVVILEMVTGRRFFDGRDLPAFLLTVLGSQVPKPSSMVPGLPLELDGVIARALAKKPMLRYHSARELCTDLQKVLAVVEDSGYIPDRPRPPEPDLTGARLESYERVLAAAAATSGVLILTALAGFATSIMYNSAFGITPRFQNESALEWPFWGFRSLIAPVAYVVRAAVVLMVLSAACRLSAKLRVLRRWCDPVSRITRGVSQWLTSLPTPALAQILLVAHCAVIGANYWWFSDLMGGLDSLIVQTHPGNLAALAPANRGEHQLYRQVLSLELAAFGAAWYAIAKMRRERRERSMDVGIAGGGALIIMTLFLLVFPYRVLYHNKHERVTLGSETCYLISEREPEALLFCPTQAPRRHQVVRLEDARLERAGAEEDVFTRLVQPK
jgi:serine/threonine protein kinase